MGDKRKAKKTNATSPGYKQANKTTDSRTINPDVGSKSTKFGPEGSAPKKPLLAKHLTFKQKLARVGIVGSGSNKYLYWAIIWFTSPLLELLNARKLEINFFCII